MIPRVVLGAALALALVAPGASAQTRLSLVGGGLVPFGDLGDTTDPSVRFGLRAEYHPVNLIGQKRPLSFHLMGAYSSLDLESGFQRSLEEQGADADAYLAEISAGVRAYSAVAPFFITGGAGWSRYRPGGDSDGFDGVDANVGLGFVVPVTVALVEVEGALHQVFAEQGVDFQYLTDTLGLGLPF
jgi:hypothetical protein